MAVKVLKFFREHFAVLLDLITAVIALFVVLIADIQAPQLNKWVLTVLALMAISGVAQRLGVINKIRQKTEDLYDVIRKLPQRPGFFLKTYQSLPSLEERLKGKSTIWLSGRTLSKVIELYSDLFKKKILNEGCSIKILLVDTNGDVPKAERLQHHNEVSLETCETRAQAMSSTFENLKREIRLKSDKLELRVLDYSPRFGLMITNPHNNDGIVQVQLLTHWCSSGSRPIFRISKGDDQFWFDEFVKQFEKLWDKASPLWTEKAETANQILEKQPD